MDEVKKKIEKLSMDFIDLDRVLADKNYALTKEDKEDVLALIDIFQGLTTNLRIRVEEGGEIYRA